MLTILLLPLARLSMSTLFKTRPLLQAANDGFPPAPKIPPRAVPLVILGPPKENHRYRRLALTFAVMLAGFAALFRYANVAEPVAVIKWVLPYHASPTAAPFGTLQEAESKPDPETFEPYAETITPPPANIVAPMPVAPALPIDDTPPTPLGGDLSIVLAYPASSLDRPDPPTPDAIEPASKVNKIHQAAPVKIQTRPREDLLPMGPD
jgi:hypothetical protein